LKSNNSLKDVNNCNQFYRNTYAVTIFWCPQPCGLVLSHMCPQLLRQLEREYFMVSQIYVHPIFLSCRSFVRLQSKQSWCIIMCIDSAFFFLFLSGTGFSYFAGLVSRTHFRKGHGVRNDLKMVPETSPELVFFFRKLSLWVFVWKDNDVTVSELLCMQW